MDSTFARLVQLLHEDELRHVSPLKMFGLYREQMRVVAFDVGAEQGFLLLLPRAASQYDTAKYPSASRVIFPVLSRSHSAAMIDACVVTIVKSAGAETFVINIAHAMVLACGAGGRRASRRARRIHRCSVSR